MNVQLLTTLSIGSTLLAGCAGGAQQKTESAKQAKQPNVIFLVADDIGWGDLSCYGTASCELPNVNELASESLRFTNAHAVAATSTPSRYSLFTGEYSWRRPDTGIAPGDASMIIKPEQITVADMFKDAGYTTGAIGKWHLGIGGERGKQDWNGLVTPNPNDIGFDYFFLMAATADRTPCVWIKDGRVSNWDASAPITVSYGQPIPGEPTGKEHPELLYNLKPSHGHDQAIVNGISRIGYMKGGGKALWKDENIGDTITTQAVQYIDSHKDEPFFLYVGTNDVHVPRFPNARFRGKSGMGLRGDALFEFDYTVGEIMKALDKNGLADNTIFVLTSDNGPVVDDGYKDRAAELLGEHRPWGIFRGGKYSSFEAGTRIPFIVRWPEKIKPGVSDALVSHVDLYASLAKLVGQKVKQGAAPDSKELLDAFLGKDQVGRNYVMEAASGLSISDHQWKYIEPNNDRKFNTSTNTELGNDPKPQLYNLKEDIGEKHNLAADKPELVKKYQLLMKTEKEKGYELKTKKRK